MAALTHEPVVAPLFHDAPVIEHDDPVGMPHSHQPVRDRDRGAFVEDGIEPFLDLRLGEGVDTRGCLVEDDHARRLNEQSRQRHKLALAHRERAALFAHFGLESIFEHVEPVAAANPARGLFHLSHRWLRAASSGCCPPRSPRRGTGSAAPCRSAAASSANRTCECLYRRARSDRPGTHRTGRSACQGSICPRRYAPPARSSRPVRYATRNLAAPVDPRHRRSRHS